jgi:aspartyl protease
LPIFPYSFTKSDGCLRPVVAIRIINPITSVGFNLRALLDTGADKCILPESIVNFVNPVRSGSKNQSIGIGGKPIDSFPHDLIIQLLSQDNKVIWTSKILKIDCVNTDAPPLLGSSDFMINFNVSFNYKSENFTIEIP